MVCQEREVLSTFGLIEDEARNYDVLKQKFDSHSIKKCNVFYESACFHRRQQQLTLASALAKARITETVRQHQQFLRLEGVHAGSPPELQEQGTSVDAVMHQKRPQQSLGRCFYCDGNTHLRSACPAKSSKCHNCGNKRYFAKACLKKRVSSQRKGCPYTPSKLKGKRGQLRAGEYYPIAQYLPNWTGDLNSTDAVPQTGDVAYGNSACTVTRFGRVVKKPIRLCIDK
ncbi:hypothetical protein MRX96_006100 [Rhipicephalus microplus]